MLYFASKHNCRGRIGIIAVVFLSLVSGPLTGLLTAQSAKQATVPEPPSTAAVRGINLAMRGHCEEALPILEKSIPAITNKDLRRDAAMMRAQCGMSADDLDAVLDSLQLLHREFPEDTKMLYITTRYFSELANRAAQKLLATDSSSGEAMILVAEAFQGQGRWEEATAQYKKILEKHPNQPGVHYQLGRIILAKPLTPESAEEAKKEFEAELKINPTSPAAEFMLGNLAWRAQKLDEAVEHFTRATQFDAGLPQPYLGLGLALNTAGKYSEAIKPLERYIELAPDDAAGYYQLAIAQMRTGNKEEADRLMALHKEIEKTKPQLVVAPPQEIQQPH